MQEKITKKIQKQEKIIQTSSFHDYYMPKSVDFGRKCLRQDLQDGLGEGALFDSR